MVEKTFSCDRHHAAQLMCICNGFKINNVPASYCNCLPSISFSWLTELPAAWSTAPGMSGNSFPWDIYLGIYACSLLDSFLHKWTHLCSTRNETIIYADFLWAPFCVEHSIVYPSSPVVMISILWIVIIYYANSIGHSMGEISFDHFSVVAGWSGHDLRWHVGATKLQSDWEHTSTPLHGAHRNYNSSKVCSYIVFVHFTFTQLNIMP